MEAIKINCVKARMVRGEMQYNRMSRFVQEIPQELLDKKMDRKREAVSAAAFMDAQAKPNPYQTSRQVARTKPYDTIFDKKPYGAKPMSAEELLKSGIMRKGSDMIKKTGASEGKAGNTNGLGYNVGDTVKHIKFGVGTVVSITDAGRDYEVSVNFQSTGIKKMFASFAKLKKQN